MRKIPMKVDWTCESCGRETEVTVYPIIPAQLYGPPENCYPEEGGEIDPDKCECGKDLPAEELWEKAADKRLCDMEDRADAENERRREDLWERQHKPQLNEDDPREER